VKIEKCKVVIWATSASPALAAKWSSVLPAKALAACERFSPTERDRRIVRAAMRRTVLSALVGLPPSELEIKAVDGRPQPPAGLGGSLSASHHDDFTALALSPLSRVGVDAEPFFENDWDAALEEVLAGHELEELQRLPPHARPAAYFRLWTLKEAVMKALGEGLETRDPRSIEIDLRHPPAIARIDFSCPGEPWALSTFEIDGHFVSVAQPGAGSVGIEIRRWPQDLVGASAILSENPTT
jgi:4'-phosphopantetheinyl transferase